MSENKQEVCMLEQLKKQHQVYCAQRDQAQVQFQQLVGAIFAIENVIKNHEETLKQHLQELAKAAQGVSEDGETDNKDQEQAA